MESRILVYGAIVVVVLAVIGGLVTMEKMKNKKIVGENMIDGGSGNVEISGNSEDVETAEMKEAFFAGGCFWCMESDFEKLDGVEDVISGYSGGDGEDPSYEDYVGKGHIEIVKIVYDANKISYERLLEHFWTHIDPLDGEGQFCDRGYAYSSAIFYQDESEKKLAEESKVKVGDVLGEEIATNIFEFNKFWEAEEYHQSYYTKNPIRYKFYRGSCGRDSKVAEIWDGKTLSLIDSDYSDFVKPSDEELREQLSDIQYKVTQKEGTERAFSNEYWDNHEEGIYVDIVSGEPLFSSTDKFDSGTGWPSFFKPLDPDFVIEREDNRLFVKRTEIRSRYANSHLGHTFNDGPGGVLRYCMNSAALRFVPKDELAKEGYGEYLGLF